MFKFELTHFIQDFQFEKKKIGERFMDMKKSWDKM